MLVVIMVIVMIVVIVDHGYGEGGGGGADDDDGSEHDDDDEIPNNDANDVSTCTCGLLFSAPALGRVQRPLLLHVHERQRGAPPVGTFGLHPPPQPTLRGAQRLPHPLRHPA